MPTTDYAIDAFINALRQNVDDINQRDIDENLISFRASKSYWIDSGWIADRWRDHSLPQIGVFTVGGGVIGEGILGERYEEKRILVDIFASGAEQRQKLTEQVKNALLLKAQRNSLNSSGVKLDRFLSEADSIMDDMMPEEVFRKQMTFRIIYRASGT